jgi:hypothetical protein
VTFNGTNAFAYNGDAGSESGLWVMADGTIKINNLTAINNHFFGAFLNNKTNWALNSFTSFGSVLITGYGSLMGNSNSSGLYIITHGSVTLNRITANNNSYGMEIYADGNVTLVCSAALNNGIAGVYVDAPGMITLKGLMTYLNFFNESFINYTSLVRTTCP